MSKGIALEFRNRYIDNIAALRLQKGKVGDCLYHKDNHRFVFYLVTKRMFYDKPLYSDLEKCLGSLKDLCEQNHIQDLALPKIGCGLDQLDWYVVAELLHEIFRDSLVHLHIYDLELNTNNEETNISGQMVVRRSSRLRSVKGSLN